MYILQVYYLKVYQSLTFFPPNITSFLKNIKLVTPYHSSPNRSYSKNEVPTHQTWCGEHKIQLSIRSVCGNRVELRIGSCIGLSTGYEPTTSKPAVRALTLIIPLSHACVLRAKLWQPSAAKNTRCAWAGGAFFPVVLLCVSVLVLAGNRFWCYLRT